MSRSPLTNEVVLEDQEGQANKIESLVDTKGISEVTTKVTNVKPNPAASSVPHQSNSVIITHDDDSSNSNNSVHTGNKMKVAVFKDTLESMKRITASDSRREKKKVLVLSSVGRSGSSFLSLILAALGNNMYFFEPIRQIPKKNINKESSIEELIKYFHCERSDRLVKSMKNIFVNIIHPYTRSEPRNQLTVEGLIKHCMQEPLIIIKTIRVRLQWLQNVMHQKELDNLKVIHLVRDPRGSFTSMSKLKWNVTDADVCDKIYQVRETRYSV